MCIRDRLRQLSAVLNYFFLCKTREAVFFHPKKYFQKISKNNRAALQLNDDVFFDKSKELVISVDTYIEGIHFVNFKYPNLAGGLTAVTVTILLCFL